MSKMTTEQFLSHLEIEVGKPFKVNLAICSEWEFKVDVSEFGLALYDRDKGKPWSVSAYIIGWLLDKEIIPLPKYTLTEEDKCIIDALRTYDKDCYFLRNDDDDVNFFNQNDVCLFTFFKKANILNCIPEFNKVSLDELRKCL